MGRRRRLTEYLYVLAPRCSVCTYAMLSPLQVHTSINSCYLDNNSKLFCKVHMAQWL